MCVCVCVFCSERETDSSNSDSSECSRLVALHETTFVLTVSGSTKRIYPLYYCQQHVDTHFLLHAGGRSFVVWTKWKVVVHPSETETLDLLHITPFHRLSLQGVYSLRF